MFRLGPVFQWVSVETLCKHFRYIHASCPSTITRPYVRSTQFPKHNSLSTFCLGNLTEHCMPNLMNYDAHANNGTRLVTRALLNPSQQSGSANGFRNVTPFASCNA